MIDKATALKAFIDGLDKTSILYVDLEGNNLSRKGTLSLITILVEPRHTVHLVDVTTLGKEGFSVPGSSGTTLQHILESSDITKVFYDIRNDSDALFSLFGVRVGGIEDLQLMELGTRTRNRKLVKGLDKSIEQDAQLSAADIKAWKEVKDAGRKLFAPELGGSYAVFDERPLSAEVQKYSVQDVVYMPAPRKTYLGQLHPEWKAKVAKETVARIALSQSAGYDGQSKDKVEGPKGWQEILLVVEKTATKKA
jgi:exonuclease 3'-5' domain-containing protein 1